jgi:hypothetical protein
VNIYNCHFYRNIHSLYCDAQYVWNVDFSHNTVEMEIQDSVYSYYGRQWTISDNRIYDCGNWTRNTYGGIVINGTLGGLVPMTWVVEGNTIQNHWEVNCMNYSVWLTGTMDHMIVSGNSLVNATHGTGIKTTGLVWSNTIVLSPNEGFNSGYAADVSEASYIIYTDSTTVYAKNGTTGLIDFASTNASYVFNTIVGLGKTSVKKGSYSITSPIVITTTGTDIEFEYGSVLTANLDGYLFHIGDGSTLIADVKICGATIWGTSTTNGLFLLNYVKNSELSDMRMSYLSEVGSYAINSTNAWENLVDHCFIYNSQNGIWVGATGYMSIVDTYINAWDYGSHGTTVNYELNLNSGTATCARCTFEGDVAKTIGVYIGWPGGDNFVDCGWEGGTHLLEINVTTTGLLYYSSLSGGVCDVTRITIPAANRPYFSWDGGHFRQNGVQASCVNGTAIAHGLGVTPTTVTISIQGTQYMNSTCWLLTPTVITMNSTYFVISMIVFNAGTISAVGAVDARTIMWDCWYKP